MARILIADHLSERRNILCMFLRADERVLIPVARETEAVKSLREAHVDLIILEGTVAGTKLLSEAKQIDSGTAVIMLMGGPPSVEQLVELMNQGVSDVLVSPLDINDVQTKVERALSWCAQNLSQAPTLKEVADSIHVSSSHLRRLFWQVRRMSPRNTTSHLYGKSSLRPTSPAVRTSTPAARKVRSTLAHKSALRSPAIG